MKKWSSIQCFNCFNSVHLISDFFAISTMKKICFAANSNMLSIFEFCFADGATVSMEKLGKLRGTF